MPLYDYKCSACGNIREVRHGFNESHSEPCPACGGTMSRVFNPAPILFKGSGFYVTDSRPNGKTGGAPKTESKTEPTSETKTGPKSETKTEPKGETKGESAA